MKFVSRGSGYNLFLTENEAILSLGPAKAGSPARAVRIQPVGADAAQAEGVNSLSARSNYFQGNDARQWQTDITNYAGVRYQSIYPGIDMRYHGSQQQLEQEFILAPGASPSAITLRFQGATRLKINAAGELLISTEGGQLRLQKPLIYQETAAGRQAIAGQYLLKSKNEIGFQVDNFDESLALVISPTFTAATQLGNSFEQNNGITVDRAGNVYVTGLTSPLDITGNADNHDLFVMKLNAAGNGMVWASYIGGNGIDRGDSIALDGNGNVYIAGATSSTNFPTTEALQTANAGGQDGFLVKLNEAGNALAYSSYLGGSGDDRARGLAVDSDGNAYLTGVTSSKDFPAAASLQAKLHGEADAFAVKIDVANNALAYATYLGGRGTERGNAIAVDNAGNAFITGETSSADFPTASALQAKRGGESDAFLVKLTAAGNALEYATYFGGSASDAGKGIVVDSDGNAYVAGETASLDLPTANALQAANRGGIDAFAFKMNAAGNALEYATYLGGSKNDAANSIAIDGNGQAFIAGETRSADFPLADANQSIFGGKVDSFIAKLNGAGSQLEFATYLGGRSNERANGIAVDGNGNAFVTGKTLSTDSVIVSALPNTIGNLVDVFVARIQPLQSSVVITGFTPTSGPVGTSVVITGMNFTGTNMVFFESAIAQFTVNSNTQITAIVPPAATTGSITVSKSETDNFVSTAIFTVTQGSTIPTISSFSPTTGPIGSNVTITGTNLGNTTSVQFNGTVAPFTINSPNQITTTVPNNATSGVITVTTPNGTATSPASFTVGTPNPNAPTVSGFTPTSGPVGTSVVITGSNFTGSTAVRFNTTNAVTFTVNSPTQITATVPTGATTGAISVTNPNGTGISATSFTVAQSTTAPTISNFTPASGPVGTTVTITGTNFVANGTSIQFNGTTAGSFLVNSTTQLTVLVPTGATTGPITVTTANGTATSQTNFVVASNNPNAPTVTSFTPTSGTAGTNVTITGTNFTGATSVQFNGATAPFIINSATQITATVPTNATTGMITVTTANGTGGSATNFIVPGGANVPIVTSFTPASGPVGTNVTITGSNFTGATTVQFNGVTASFTLNSATQITATVPAGATSGLISVTTPSGTGASTTSFMVTTTTPAITSFTPASGPVGTTVTINGVNFGNVNSVQFGGATAMFIINSPTQISAVVPATASNGPITVSGSNGTGSSTTNFIVTTSGVNAPTVTSFSPGNGSAGTTVTITGTNFTGATSVQFNGTPTTMFIINSATQITAVVPNGATTGLVSVTTPNGTGASATNFSIASTTPGLTSFSPVSGPVGTTVTLTGQNLTGTTAVLFNGLNASFTVNSATQITTTVPANATTGPITIINQNGNATSPTNFVVTTASAPSISSFTPISGPVGTTVTLSGANFMGVTAVQFNGSASTFTVNSPTQITATVPANATTGPIIVTSPAGTTTSPTVFTVLSAPTINSISPASALPGATVTINGSNFTGATTVRFNGVGANFSVLSPSQISAIVPATATTGPVTVITPAGTATSPAVFSVILVPTISTFTPASGQAGTVVTINGTNFTGATAVNFGGAMATFNVTSPTQIIATVPLGATTGPVTVITPGGTIVSTTPFTVLVDPTITSFSPTSGPVGTMVNIIGANLNGASAVQFNGVTATFTATSPTQVTATVPAGATTGPITIVTPGGTVTSPMVFTVIPAPAVTTFTPNVGAPGTRVTITGSNFTGATAVNFGSVSSTFTIDSPTQITATVPAGATTGPITVVTPGGTVISANIFTIRLIMISDATYSKPNLFIAGMGFGTAGARVTINGTDVSAKIRTISDTAITIKASRKKLTLRAGPNQVTVTSANGTVSNTFTLNVLRSQL